MLTFGGNNDLAMLIPYDFYTVLRCISLRIERDMKYVIMRFISPMGGTIFLTQSGTVMAGI